MKLDPVDVLVFAPHPDDEVIGCAGVIQQGLAAGRRVRVAFSTDGDGYPLAAAVLFDKPASAITPADLARLGEVRRREAKAAAGELGLGESSLVFLGFPDGALGKVPQAQAVQSFDEVILRSGAMDVYVTAAVDEHHDHAATYRYVVEAMKTAGAKSRLFTFLVHACGNQWPSPGPRFERVTTDGGLCAGGLEWPPPIRIPLTPEQSAAKLRALKAHASQWALDHDYLGRFAKSEEIFWGNHAT